MSDLIDKTGSNGQTAKDAVDTIASAIDSLRSGAPDADAIRDVAGAVMNAVGDAEQIVSDLGAVAGKLGAGDLLADGEMAKAVLYNLDTNTEILKCNFNPKDYSISREAKWKDAPNKGTDVPAIEFTSTTPATMTLKLFFDTFEKREDVRKIYTDKIWSLLDVSTDAKVKSPRSKKSRPPKVQIRWGKTKFFDAVITKIDQSFSLFLSDGTPVRAEVTIGLQQVKKIDDYPKQNPTSGGMPGQRIRTVREGETIDRIAYEEYGDSTLWRHIAAANNLSNPMKLTPGTVLGIPTLP